MFVGRYKRRGCLVSWLHANEKETDSPRIYLGKKKIKKNEEDEITNLEGANGWSKNNNKHPAGFEKE